MQAIVIVNPHAHSGNQPDQIDVIRDEISAQLKSALSLEAIQWCETEYPGHAKLLAAEAVQKGFRYVFAGGGDGTINEVLNGIMGLKLPPGQRPILGVLPLGTSNDFFVALKTAESSRHVDEHDTLTLVLDVGHILFDNVERYFCLTVGIGLFSWVNEQYLDASRIFGRRFAHIPAAIRTIMSYQFRPNVKIWRNGKQTRIRRMLSVVVNNSAVIAGGTPLTPNAKIDDGEFDMCIVKPISLPRLIWLALQISRKAHTHSPDVELSRIRDMTVVARQALPIHVDGELVPELESKARRMTVSIMPGALRIVVPSICEIAPKPAEPAVVSA